MFDIGKIVYGIVGDEVKELKVTGTKVSDIIIDGEHNHSEVYSVSQLGYRFPFDLDSDRVFETKEEAEKVLHDEKVEEENRLREEHEYEERKLNVEAEETLNALKTYSRKWDSVESIETALKNAFKDGSLFFKKASYGDYNKYITRSKLVPVWK